MTQAAKKPTLKIVPIFVSGGAGDWVSMRAAKDQCNPSDEIFMNELLDQTGDERRSDARLLCAELVELTWEDSFGKRWKKIANLEDISLAGVCLQAESPIPRGTQVKVHYGDGELVGTVRYCLTRDLGYFLGIQFVEGCRWSTKHFRPEHLLDPRDLVDQALRRHELEPENPAA